ncbi:ISLre2 family transposase, partial [Clostridium sporogenes]
LGELFDYFVANREGIVPYHLRKEINMPQAPEGLEYRHLGTMEHNICDVLAQRMKGRKMSWSISGANNLAKILAEKAGKRIYDVLEQVCYQIIPQDKMEIIKEMIVLTAADVNKKAKKGNLYPVHQASTPFACSAVTNGRKAIQSFLRERSFSELIYR